MHVGIIGGGRMGQDVFDLFARSGFQVTLVVRRASAATELDEALLGPLRRRAAKGGRRGDQAAEQLTRLAVSNELARLSSCDLINENASEDLALKRALFSQLESVVGSQCILSSDSSFLTPDSYAQDLRHPERVVGLHFFYPTRLMSFAEVIPWVKTLPEVTERTVDAVKKLNIRPILCRNVPGFLVNRMIPAFYIEGVLMLEEGQYTAGEIDAIARPALTHVGPLEACDQIGIDLVGKKHDMPDLWRKGWIEPAILDLLVAAGRLGVKSGRGIYVYPEGRPVDESDALPHSPRLGEIPAYSKQDVLDRLFYNVVVEAFRQLDLGVGTAEDIDSTLCEVLGFKTGPIAAAHKLGLEKVRERLNELTIRFGERFSPRGSLT